MKYFFAAILFFTSFAINAAKQWQDFAHLPIIQRPSVSPDGQQIAMLYNSGAASVMGFASYARNRIASNNVLQKQQFLPPAFLQLLFTPF